MKKIVALLLAALLLTASAAFAETSFPAGGWTPAASPEITEENKALLDQALEGLVGVNYVPVAYLGSQIVAGVNHCFLCQATVVYPGALPTYALVYLYQDLAGSVTLLNIAELDIGALCTYGAEE